MLKKAIDQLCQRDSKFNELYQLLTSLAPFALAFSGGVDSTLLLAICSTLNQARNCLALTIKTPYIAKWELKEAMAYSTSLNFKHDVVALAIPELIKNNPKLRCYYCKNALMTEIIDRAKRHDIKTIIDGTNYDDLSDYRPGLKALRENGVISPFLECQVTKQDIRQWSKFLNLKTWDKPAYACLLTRLETDKPIEESDLDLIEAAEMFLFSLGIRDVRVRKHENLARIEVPEDVLQVVFEQRNAIVEGLAELGFDYITLDMVGYRMSGLQHLKRK